jgi:hypothetical protein
VFEIVYRRDSKAGSTNGIWTLSLGCILVSQVWTSSEHVTAAEYSKIFMDILSSCTLPPKSLGHAKSPMRLHQGMLRAGDRVIAHIVAWANNFSVWSAVMMASTGAGIDGRPPAQLGDMPTES